MDEHAWQRVKEVFRSAVEVAPTERLDVLDAVDDAAVRAEVEALLRVHDEDGPAPGVGAVPDSGEGPGTVIGRYRLLQEIGEGGFGVVYMAEQTEPVRRRVALKIIKRGMDTRQVVARFEAERQALALMNHPNIAKVHDGGATDSGRPYFVLELVRGVPITEYCDQAGLDTKERLELFRTVCHAIQHAHQKGVIHRDIKPANVLVAVDDGQPVPKVIDFGIAKATERHLTERTLFTQYQEIVGTPDYMAPEQAEVSGLDIDTRADVYSLGVLLYELLTGTKPFDLKAILDKGYEELLRTIREVDPPPPSTRLGSRREDLASVARHRHTPQKLLGKIVRGDLDWIVMKALEKDRSRRYGTASDLAEDVQRHLEDRPVRATPPSALDRIRKYVRRHRAGTFATVAVLLALVAGLVLALLGRAESRRQAELARRAEEEARLEADRATTAMGMLGDMLSLPGRVAGRGPNITVRLMLEDFERTLPERVRGRPDVEVHMRLTLATAWDGLGDIDRAEEHVRIAFDLAERVLGRDHLLYAGALTSRGTMVRSRGRLAEAEEILRRAVALYRRHGDRAHPRNLSRVLCSLADVLRERGQLAEAEALAREALDLRRRHLGEDHPETAVSLGQIALVLRSRGDVAGAERLHRQSLENQIRILGENHPAVARGRYDLGICLLEMGRLDEAEATLLRALDERRRLLGEDHPETLWSLHGLAKLRLAQSRPADAEALLRQCLEARRSVLGEESPGVIFTLEDLAEARAEQNDLDEAGRLLDEALDLSRRVYGARSFRTGAILANRGIICWRREDLERAERLLRESLDIRRHVLGEDHPETAHSAGSLSMLLSVRGDHAAAVPLARRAFETWRSRLGETNLRTTMAGIALATSLWLSGDPAGAEEVARNVLETARPTGKPRSGLLSLLGGALLDQDRPEEAEAPLRKALAMRVRDQPDHWLRWSVAGDLGASLAGQRKFAEAEPLLIESYENMRPPPSLAHRRAEALERVVALYEAWGKPEMAAAWREKTSGK